MIYAINYDLKQPGRDYSGVYEAIKSCGAWWHFLESTWLVDTTLSAQGIWDQLAPHIHRNDYVLIHSVGRNHQGWLQQRAGTGSTAASRRWRRRGSCSHSRSTAEESVLTRSRTSWKGP